MLRMNPATYLIILSAATNCSFAADPSFGLIRSADNGLTWRDPSDKFRTNRVNALTISTDRLWAGTEQGLFSSVDEGREWTQVTESELSRARVLCLLTAEGVMLTGTERGGLWRSIDDGRTWSRAWQAKYVRSLAWSEGQFWAGLDNGTVWASTDLGISWRSKSDGLPENGQIFDMRADSKGHLYAGLYSKGFFEFRDRVWRRVGQEARPHSIFVAEDVLLSGNNPGGIRRSVDGGASWSHLTETIAPDAPSWTFLGVAGTIYYGTTGLSGLYASRDRGESWEPLAVDYLHNRAVVALVSDGKTIFAATVHCPTRTGLDTLLEGEVIPVP
jgi:photosystem II stability/assembly factor-like uncharacterized protein